MPITNYNDTYDKLRRQILNLIFVSIIVMFTAEIGCFILLYNDIPNSYSSVWIYVLLHLVAPLVINLTAFIIETKIDKKDDISTERKNLSIMLCFTAVGTNLACCHSYFVCTLSVFAVPIVVSSIFADKKLTSIIGGISIVGMSLAYFISTFDGRRVYEYRFLELIIAMAISIVSYVISLALINHETFKQQKIVETVLNEFELAEKLRYDGLTGLYNYAYFSQLFDETLDNREKYKSIHLAIIDIDNFKSVNDTWGHEVGNIVLKKLAELLLTYCNTSGTPARYGGEEFAVIFTNVTLKEAFEAIEILRKYMAAERFMEMGDKVITFSCGLTSYKRGFTQKTMIVEADKAMYEAKHNGKNQTVII